MVKKTYYKVNLNGEVTIEATDEANALVKAKDFFVTTGQGLAWAVVKVDVQINHPQGNLDFTGEKQA
jgi:1,2-phenylacetyl-CoA epoxidase PaaB subunit